MIKQNETKMKNENTKKGLDQALSQYLNGLTNGIQTARRMDEVIGGINGVTFKNGSLSLDDGENKYSLHTNQLSRKEMKGLEKDLVPCLDIVRTKNGLGNGTEAHIGRGCSTKHYRAGYNALVASVAAQYGV